MHVVFVSQQFGLQQDALLGLDPAELVLVVDVDRCIACGACAVACRGEHAPFGELAPVRRILGGGNTPNVLNLPTSCRFCSTPCAADTGNNFWTVCPADKAEGVASSAVPCDACAERLSAGLAPACVTRCCMKCLYAGRAEDVRFALEERRLRGMGETRIC